MGWILNELGHFLVALPALGLVVLAAVLLRKATQRFRKP